MSYLFEFGEGLFCLVPIFTIIGFIFLALIWNNLPDRTVKRKRRDDDEQKD